MSGRKGGCSNTYLNEHLEASRTEADPEAYLFRSTRGCGGELTSSPLAQPDAYRMIRRRAAGAGIRTKNGNHTFRATGISEHLRKQWEVGNRLADGQP